MDENVSWGGTYAYYIKAHYNTNAMSGEGYASITLGSALCEGIFGSEEFCLNATYGTPNAGTGDINRYRYYCNGSNVPKPTTQSPNCNPGVCVGPDQSGKTKCVNRPNCIEIGPNLLPARNKPYPFGLYYTEPTCLNSGNNWCYYDYSDTTVDECNNCTSISCNDYRSQNACLADNCRAGRSRANGGNADG